MNIFVDNSKLLKKLHSHVSVSFRPHYREKECKKKSEISLLSLEDIPRA